MGEYFNTPSIEGERPFKCYVCNKLLIVDIDGEYSVRLQCSRCKTKITLETQKSLPDGLVVKHGILTKI
jgi:phage FluMu protein Com